MRCSRPRRAIRGGVPLLPFGDRLLVDAMALSQGPQARLTILYCSTDCRCRCGAAVENLAHSASLHSGDKNAPSNPGIKHLMGDLFLLSERQMARISPYFPLPHGVPRVDDRQVVSGIVDVIRNGLQWKDAPKEYGLH